MTKSAKGRRVFLVVADDSEEMRAALEYACIRALNTGGQVALLHVLEKPAYMHWMTVENIRMEEDRAAAEALLLRLSERVNELTGGVPVLFLREGDCRECLLELIENDPSISILVLGAATTSKGPGPLVSSLTSKLVGKLRIPITVVPGNLTRAQLKEIC